MLVLNTYKIKSNPNIFYEVTHAIKHPNVLDTFNNFGKFPCTIQEAALECSLSFSVPSKLIKKPNPNLQQIPLLFDFKWKEVVLNSNST